MNNQEKIIRLNKNIKACKIISILNMLIPLLAVFFGGDVALYFVCALLGGHNVMLIVMRISYLTEAKLAIENDNK